MAKLWRCIVCGDPYIGSNPPDNCPFCGAHLKYIQDAKTAEVSFDVELTETDRVNAQRALEVEVSNSTFYFQAAERTDHAEGRLLFKALGKVEKEHASIWKKVLKLDSIPPGSETCSEDYKANLQESHERESRAIAFYRQAAEGSGSERIKELFGALVEIETDHLDMSAERLA